jgi:hypothetical protein
MRRFPPEDYIRLFDRSDPLKGYRYVPATALSWCREIAGTAGAGRVEDYHKVVLLRLIAGFEERFARLRVPESVGILIPQAFQRILSQLAAAEPGYFLHENDLFAKDLGLCRLKLLPCGSELVEPLSGVPRSVMFQGGHRHQRLPALVSESLGSAPGSSLYTWRVRQVLFPDCGVA